LLYIIVNSFWLLGLEFRFGLAERTHTRAATWCRGRVTKFNHYKLKLIATAVLPNYIENLVATFLFFCYPWEVCEEVSCVWSGKNAKWRPNIFHVVPQNGICPYASGRTSPVLEKSEAGSTYYKTYFYGKGTGMRFSCRK
jgi:hypothetical protein